jgi:2-amino-4-hydroxy-6-hydroxymethyldihydropteridine diphosphokinase
MPDVDVFSHSAVVSSTPVGPAQRQFANAAAIVSTDLMPDHLLQRLHMIEAHFGRQRRGQKWRSRILDLDIVLWTGGMWISDSPDLVIPHREAKKRGFVLGPAALIAPDWVEPVSGLTIRQLHKRLMRPKPLDRPDRRL